MGNGEVALVKMSKNDVVFLALLVLFLMVGTGYVCFGLKFGR